MYFPFLISLQQEKLKTRAVNLAQRKLGLHAKPVNGVKSATIEVNDACKCFKDKTLSPFNKIKSFIPGTKAFRLRLICANRLQHLNKLLDKVEIAIANGKPIPPNLNQVNGSKSIKKSYSDTDIIVKERTYKSPISQPLSRDDCFLTARPKYYTTNFRVIEEENVKPVQKLL